MKDNRKIYGRAEKAAKTLSTAKTPKKDGNLYVGLISAHMLAYRKIKKTLLRTQNRFGSGREKFA